MVPDESGLYGQIMTERLLLTVIEQLKQPLLNIARRAEVAETVPDPGDIGAIRVASESALHLLDNYMLGVQLAANSSSRFEAEPVSVSAVLHDTGNQLRPLAKAYGVTLKLQVDGKFGPVMAHRQALQAALVSLGYALVEALPAQEPQQLELRLSAHRCRYGIVAGMYCEMEQLTSQALRFGRRLQGRARQPLNTWSHTSAAGVFVADAILRAMHARLTASRHHRMHGLGAVLPLNPQLQLV